MSYDTRNISGPGSVLEDLGESKTNRFLSDSQSLKNESKRIINFLKSKNNQIITVLCINPFQSSVAFNIETSNLFCSAKQMTGFYIKRKTGLKWINVEYDDYLIIFQFFFKLSLYRNDNE